MRLRMDESSLNADEDNVVHQRSPVIREEHFKRLRKFLGFCSNNLQLLVFFTPKNKILASSTPG